MSSRKLHGFRFSYPVCTPIVADTTLTYPMIWYHKLGVQSMRIFPCFAAKNGGVGWISQIWGIEPPMFIIGLVWKHCRKPQTTVFHDEKKTWVALRWRFSQANPFFTEEDPVVGWGSAGETPPPTPTAPWAGECWEGQSGGAGAGSHFMIILYIYIDYVIHGDRMGK